jgi:hypothetical protein
MGEDRLHRASLVQTRLMPKPNQATRVKTSLVKNQKGTTGLDGGRKGPVALAGAEKVTGPRVRLLRDGGSYG